MEPKKNPHYDLERRSPLFFSIGLVISLLLVTVAFEWKGAFDPVDLTAPEEAFEEPYIIPNTHIPAPKPPKPQVMPQVVKPEQIRQVVESNELTEIFEVQKQDVFVPDIPLGDLPPAPPPPKVFDIVESMPEYPGGIQAFYEYVGKNIHYPSNARRMDVEGTVYVQFVINEDGTLSEITSTKGIGFGCDEEALKVLRKSPRWIPGKQRGRPVKVRMTLPIQFVLAH